MTPNRRIYMAKPIISLASAIKSSADNVVERLAKSLPSREERRIVLAAALLGECQPADIGPTDDERIASDRTIADAIFIARWFMAPVDSAAPVAAPTDADEKE